MVATSKPGMDGAADHEGAATAFFDTSEASRNFYPCSCPWKQHAEYVSHLPKIKSPAARTTGTEEWRAQEF